MTKPGYSWLLVLLMWVSTICKVASVSPSLPVTTHAPGTTNSYKRLYSPSTPRYRFSVCFARMPSYAPDLYSPHTPGEVIAGTASQHLDLHFPGTHCYARQSSQAVFPQFALC
ncbi:hypothetical protein ElyMa_003804900 [Elysia marginata]|uniref:Secreted protein n=1 Tax=Elysia marginata TaxID=1093978 RepID=A0AAV4FCL5_9GAST|nr:hypothetical protein ElyMa_003804900 [Elysia marginata]